MDLTKFLNDIMVLLLQFVAIFAGYYIKEYFTRIKVKGEKIQLERIAMASMALSFVLIGFSAWLMNMISSIEVYFTGCFLIGISADKFISLLISGEILNFFGKIFFNNIKEALKSSGDKIKKEK